MGFIIGYVWVGTSVDDCNNRVDQNTAYVDDGWYANLSCLALIVEGGRRGREGVEGWMTLPLLLEVPRALSLVALVSRMPLQRHNWRS